MTTESISENSGTSLRRSIATGGFIIAITHAVIVHVIFVSIIGGNSLITLYQYIASGALGLSAFEGGIGTALIGVVIHFFVSYVITAIYFISADRVSLIGRFPIAISLIYGFLVFIVMNIIVTPLSATPTLPEPSTFEIVFALVEEIAVSGLLVGILAKRRG